MSSGVVIVSQAPVELFDAAGNPILVKDGDTITPATQPVLPLAGVDGTTARALRVDSAGRTKVQADALPLPAGAASEATLAAIRDTAGIKKITDALPAGSNLLGSVAQGTKATGSDGWPVVLYDSAGNAISTQLDTGVRRLEIAGKVSVIGAVPPPATNEARINADTPLTVGSHDTTFTIPNGEVFHLQQVTAGNEDPTKGAVIEIIFDDGAEHLIERVYTNGNTISIGFSDISEARDGASLVGNGTNTIVVRRTKFSGSNIAIDAGVRGYTV